MGPGAQIRWHSAYTANSEQGSGSAHALLGAYLNRVGLPYSAVVYIMQNAPQSITWLGMADAKRLGIEVSSLDSGPIVSEAPQSAATLVGRLLRTPPCQLRCGRFLEQCVRLAMARYVNRMWTVEREFNEWRML
jgi:hypothetical protein